MQIYCPNCALEISVDEGLLGNKGQCPKCSHKFIVSLDNRHPPEADDLGTAPTIKIIKDETFDFDLGGGRKPWMGADSFWSGIVCLVFFVVSSVVLGWASLLETKPEWMHFPAGFHDPFVHGGLALLLAAAILEVVGRTDRFEFLQVSAPFLLGLAVLALFVANLLGACHFVGWGAQAGMSLFAFAMTSLALVLGLVANERPEGDRTMFLIVMVLGIGALLLVVHLGMSSPAGD